MSRNFLFWYLNSLLRSHFKLITIGWKLISSFSHVVVWTCQTRQQQQRIDVKDAKTNAEIRRAEKGRRRNEQIIYSKQFETWSISSWWSGWWTFNNFDVFPSLSLSRACQTECRTRTWIYDYIARREYAPLPDILSSAWKCGIIIKRNILKFLGNESAVWWIKRNEGKDLLALRSHFLAFSSSFSLSPTQININCSQTKLQSKCQSEIITLRSERGTAMIFSEKLSISIIFRATYI